ncbi:MAG: ArsA-related P-loop ATPase, partial [Desulfobaccales bacterium]
FDVPFDRQVMERMLDLSPPGLDEIMALVRAMGFLEQGRYDIFILDSAPTGHLLRLLELPELIDQWLKTFFGLLLKYKLAFRFQELSQQLVRISRDLKLLRNLWRDPARAALYAVTILTEMAFQETSDLLATCGRLGVPAPVLLLNLATPGWDCLLCAALNRRETLIKDKFQETFAGRHQTIIYRQSEPRGLKRLTALGQALYRSRTVENRHGAIADMPALSS